jgi:FkbM family methyltransferase
MAEWIINKLVVYGKNNNRYKFKLLSYIRKVLLRFKDPIIKTKIGEKVLFMNFSHQLPLYLVQHVLYDTALPRIVKKIGISKKLNIVDVGANVGDTTALIKASNNNVNLLCVEGNAAYSELLKKNYKEDKTVFIEESFCSDISEAKNISLNTKSGTATIDLNIDLDNQVNFLTLDEIMKKYNEFINVDLIKVDTDGFDYKVLGGASEILKNQQPFVFFELDKYFLLKNDENTMSIFEIFKGNSYKSFILYDNYGYLVGLFTFNQLDIVEDIIDYMYNKKMYLDVLMIKDINVAKELYKSENEDIKSILETSE